MPRTPLFQFKNNNTITPLEFSILVCKCKIIDTFNYVNLIFHNIQLKIKPLPMRLELYFETFYNNIHFMNSPEKNNVYNAWFPILEINIC